MNKSLRILLFVALAAAVLLMVLSSMRYHDLGDQLSDLRFRLSESRSNWEKTAAEKETLQKDLDEKQLMLKKTEQSLNDATKKTEELRAEINLLKKEIEALQLNQPDPD